MIKSINYVSFYKNNKNNIGSKALELLRIIHIIIKNIKIYNTHIY